MLEEMMMKTLEVIEKHSDNTSSNGGARERGNTDSIKPVFHPICPSPIEYFFHLYQLKGSSYNATR